MKYVILALCLLLVACISFITPHEQFIEAMNTTVKNSQVAKLPIDDPRIMGGFEKKYLSTINDLGNGTLIYQYASKQARGMICYFHIVVDKKSLLLISWGFNYEKGNPKKMCGLYG